MIITNCSSPQGSLSFPRLFFFNLVLQTISRAFPHNAQFSSPFIIFIDHQKSPLVCGLILRSQNSSKLVPACPCGSLLFFSQSPEPGRL